MPHIADGPLAEEAIASAATCSIGGTTKVRVEITGTTTITSFGTAVNKIRWGRFSGALTLTHHATTLILPGGANITTAAGDTFFAESDGANNWRVRDYTRANGAPVAVPARAYAEDATVRSSVATNIPADNTIPQNTEGTEILTASITPRRSDSRIRIRFRGIFVVGAQVIMTAALFKDSGADALDAGATSLTANRISPVVLEFEEAAGSTSARTYKVRVGSDSNSWHMNTDQTGTALFNGKSRATLVVEEVFAS